MLRRFDALELARERLILNRRQEIGNESPLNQQVLAHARDVRPALDAECFESSSIQRPGDQSSMCEQTVDAH